jgi:hypothetical protein
LESSFSSASVQRDSAAAASPATGRAATREPRGRLELVVRGARERASLESFIDRRFGRAYGAHPTHFCAHLLGIRDTAGRWQAAVGYTPAADGPLFLEQYLDAPVEAVLAAALGRAVARESAVEVGNLAAIDAGVARRLIAALAQRFHADGYRFAVFTATRELRNSFRRLRLVPIVLARADRTRLREAAERWGDYYSHDPVVMGGAIAAGLGAASE